MTGMLGAFIGVMGGPTVSLDALGDIDDIQLGVESSSTLTIENDGDITSTTTASGPADLGDWIRPKAAAGTNYEVRVDVNSGALTSGTTGSWLGLGTSRSWNVTDSLGDASPVEANITVQIRHAVSQNVLASVTINLTANSVSV